MSKLFHNCALALSFALASATVATAEGVECVYDSWRGAQSNNIAISWIGIGFIADAKRGVTQVKLPDGFYAEETAKLVQAADFTGFVLYRNEPSSDGSTNRVRYSFRLYTSGKCEGRMDQDGYQPIIGAGRVK